MDALQWGAAQLLGGIAALVVVPLLIYRWLTPDNCHEDTDLAIGTVIVFCGGVYALFFV